MKKITLLVTFLFLLTHSLLGMASDEKIRATIARLNIPSSASAKIESISLPGWKKVSIPDGVFFVSEDGKYFINGMIYDVSGKVPRDLGRPSNLTLLESIKNQAITYKAPNSKYDLYVFTDHTCVYCKKLHQELQSYLDQGITIHYLAFARTGPGTTEAKMLQSAWNSDNPQKALDELFKGKKLPLAKDTTEVDNQRLVGEKMEATGTPALVIASSGELIPGYLPAKDLIEYLKSAY